MTRPDLDAWQGGGIGFGLATLGVRFGGAALGLDGMGYLRRSREVPDPAGGVITLSEAYSEYALVLGGSLYWFPFRHGTGYARVGAGWYAERLDWWAVTQSGAIVTREVANGRSVAIRAGVGGGVRAARSLSVQLFVDAVYVAPYERHLSGPDILVDEGVTRLVMAFGFVLWIQGG